MIIAGLQKQSLIEYPGRISAIVFLAGCNLRCQFCFTGNNKILTDKGMVPIKDIVDNQKNYLVYTSEGTFSPINKFFKRETNELLQIKTFWHSEIIECTPNHKFLVYDARKREIIMKEADKLNKDYDFLTVTIPQEEKDSYQLDIVPAILSFYQPRRGMTKKKYLNAKALPVIKIKGGKIAVKGSGYCTNIFVPITPEFMRLIGYYLAEGCVSKMKNRKNSYYVSFTFNRKEKKLIEDVKNLFFRVFGLELSEIKNRKNKTIQLSCYKGIVGMFFKYYFGSDSLNKKIPIEFIYLKKELQKELIKGIFFGDGVMSEKFIKKYQWQRLSCCSETLRYQLSLILWRLGIRHSILEKEISIKDKKIFSILDQSHLITKKSINVGRRYGFVDGKYAYFRIKEIKKVKKRAKVFNLEINNPTHTYNIFLFNVSNCYVPHLVLTEEIKRIKPIPEKEIFSFLRERKKFLDAVAISGGEPTTNKELSDFIKKIKKIGYLVELETNGTNPKVLKNLIEKRLVDYVAMDIKHDLVFEKYNEIVGGVLTKKLFDNIKESIKILISSKIDYEFRTTIMKEFHSSKDILEICKKIKGAKKYFLQNYQKGKTISGKDFTPFGEKEIEEIVKKGQKYVNIHFRKYL